MNAVDSKEAPSPTWLIVCALLAGLAIWFFAIQGRSLISPDEGRYATLSLAMAQSGDWVTPRLNGLLYFEKPAMQYWIGAISFLVFGVNEFAARMWPALAGLLTALATGYTAARFCGRESGVQATAVTLSTTWVFGNSHFLTLDAGLTFFLTGVLCAFLIAARESDPRIVRRWVLVAWLAMAGAVLSKGLVGIVIPGATLFFVSVWRRRFALWPRLFWWPAILAFFVATVPWFWLVSSRNPGFAEFFFIHEHFQRYLSEVHHREGAWWYYVPLLIGGMLPWTGALPWLRARLPKLSGRVPDPNDPGPHGIATGDTLVVWCAFVFLFFSVSGSKLPSYILPMFPALSLLVVMRIRSAGARALRWHLCVPVALWLVALAATTQVPKMVTPATPLDALEPIAQAIRIGATVFVAGAVLAWWLIGRRQITAAVLSIALVQMLGVTLVLEAHNEFGEMKSAKPIAAVVAPMLQPDTPIFAVQSYDQTLPFYFRREVVLVDYFDEFALGQKAAPTKSIRTLDEFVQRWKALPQAMAYMNKVTWVTLAQQGLPMKVVFEDERRVAIMKP